MKTRPTSLLCPGCSKLISGYLDECSHCGLKNPSQKAKWLALLGMGGGSLIRPIIGLCIFLFGLSYLLPLVIPGTSGRHAAGFLGLLPAPSSVSLALLGWADLRTIYAGQWYQLITAIFLHGGVLHILFNMLWVRDLGRQAESLFGPKVMIFVFVFTGAAGNLLAVFWPLLATSLGYHMGLAPVVGASGAVFGLMGVMMSYAPRRDGFLGLRLSKQMGKWAFILILLGVLMPGVSNMAHIGGFIAGWLLGKVIPVKPATWSMEMAGLGALGLVLYSFGAQFFQVYLWLSAR